MDVQHSRLATNNQTIIEHNLHFSTKVRRPKDQAGELVSFSGFRVCGEYDQGDGPSRSKGKGGRADNASSIETTLRGVFKVSS